MKISMQHASLAGHFPGNPVVPGVVLLDAVAQALAERVGRAVTVTGMPSVKFLAPLLPEEEFSIAITLKDGGRAGFDVATDAHKILTGSVTYD
jgi:3-hydroxymyristoyl/3-hydroxydecanoyl-(acyl carrier protein) dehydratase